MKRTFKFRLYPKAGEIERLESALYLSRRFYNACPTCRFSVDRDLNASLNILQRLESDRLELMKTPMEMLPPQLSKGVARNVDDEGNPFRKGGRMSHICALSNCPKII